MHVKTCCSCGDTLLVSEFRPRRRGGKVLSSQCRECHNLAERERRLRRRRGDLDKLVNQLHWRRHPDQVSRLSRLAIRRFGGPAALASEFEEHYRRCHETGDTKTAAKLLLSVVQLMRTANAV